MWGLFRLFLALTVVVFHSRYRTGMNLRSPGGGIMAVEAFFTISGYVITKAIRRNYSDGFGGFLRFWQNRALRLMPPYWVALIAGLLTAPAAFINSGLGVTMHTPHGVGWIPALFIVGQTGATGPIVNANQPLLVSWSLAVELVYYLVLSALAARSRRGAEVFLILSLGIGVFGQWLPLGTMYVGTLWECLPFAVGCYLAHTRGQFRFSAPASYSFVAVAVCYIWLVPTSSLTVYGCIPFAIAAILACESIPQSRMDRFLGDLSYPVYIMQFPIMALIRGLHGWVFVIAAPIASIAAAIVINRLVEAPIAKIRARIRAQKTRLAFAIGPEAVQPINHPSAGPDVIAVPGAEP